MDYAIDTSFFPSIGAVNPALTAMANALRVGDHLLERLGVGAAASGDAVAAEHNGRAAARPPARGDRRRRLRRADGRARRCGGADVDVTLVDRHSHHLFQPLLYQLACGGLSPGGVRHPDPGGGPAHATTSAVLMADARRASTPSGAS